MTNLVQIKLVSGEWVLGEVKEQLQDNGSLILIKPLVIHIVPQGPKQYGIALIPFDPTNPDGTVEIFRSAIVARPTVIEKGLYDAYIQRTSTLEIISSLGDIK